MKLAINGFGRIGRQVLRILSDSKETEVVAINDLTDPETLSYLFRHDSVYRTYSGEVELAGGSLKVGRQTVRLLAEPDPKKLPWGDLKVDVVVESTGRFTRRADAAAHLAAGARKVLISANSADADLSVVWGVNVDRYDPATHQVIANCSCTTNCAAPVMMVLQENFEVLKAQMITVHAVTSTQSLVDSPSKNLRRSRAAYVSIVPQETGAAVAVERVLPDLAGRISGSAFRVPVICGSVLEVVAQVGRETSAEEINARFTEVANSRLQGILTVSEGGLVSSDIIGNSHSAIVDLPLTEVLDLPGVRDENLIKVVAWYDNEWGYSQRLVAVAERIGSHG